MEKAKWKSARPGDPIVHAGLPLSRVILIQAGQAEAVSCATGPGGEAGKVLYKYDVRLSKGRASVIGGTALVDRSVRNTGYPNDVIASRPTKL